MPNLNKYPKKNATKVTGDLKNRPKRWMPGLPISVYNSEPIKRNLPRNLPRVSIQPTEMFEDTLSTPSSNTSINATYIAAGLTAITSTVVTPLATLLIGQLSNESDINNMAYNVTLPALSTSTEQSNNSIFTDYSDISLPTRILFAATGIIIGSAIVPIVLYAKGYYSCRKENNEERENINSHAELENNQDAAEKGLLPTRSATLKTRAQTLQTSFMLAESASREVSKKANRNRHQFYKSLPASDSSLHEKENDHEAPRHSNS